MLTANCFKLTHDFLLTALRRRHAFNYAAYGGENFLPFIVSAMVPLRSDHVSVPPRSVAIVGAGSAGLAMLKTLLDLEAVSRDGWDIILYDERESVGGIWLPDHNDVSPPDIPETPLYPLLHTNTPVPSMAYPGFPFLPGTPLYPSHEHVEAYHLRYARHHKLLESISFHHKVQKAFWSGSSEKGYWNLTLSDKKGVLHHKAFHHLVVASGNNHIPSIPVWKGQDDWLASPSANHSRKIIHSVYYRGPEAFANQSLLIVGNGASGRDAASQVVRFARETFISIRHDNDPVEGVLVKPEISHFTEAGVVFVDDTVIDPDVILLGTGYELRKPFLSEGGELKVDPSARDNSSVQERLATNLRYIFPLYQHTLSLSPRYPVNALAFIGLPSYIANCPSDIAQSLFTAHVIADPSILPSRSVLLEELASYEEKVRAEGLDPYVNGHRMLDKGRSSEYQDDLVEFLKQKKTIPDDGKKFVEEWRRDLWNYQYLKRGWSRIEKLGVGGVWTKGIETEAQWADLMKRVNEWQKRWEIENGVEFRVDLDLAG